MRGKRHHLLLILLAACSLTARAQDDGALLTYSRFEGGALRVFDFDGATPFVNAQSGVSDLAALVFDTSVLSGDRISNSGSRSPHIMKVQDPADGQQVTRVQLLPGDRGPVGFRTQLNGFHLEPYKTYVYDLQFKLAPDWNFDMKPGAGLLWQLKGMPRPGQWGNPSLALILNGRALSIAVKYPLSAMSAPGWPAQLRWGEGEYVPAALPTRQLQAGRYYRVRIRFNADDRPPQFGGQGSVQAWFDGQPWLTREGPTLHPDQLGPHRMDFGWYQWEGQPSAVRTVYFKTSHLYQIR